MCTEKKSTASLLVHPDEFNRRWIDRCVALGIPTLSMHPVGGYRSPLTMKDMLDKLETAEYRALVDEAIEKGLTIEYEMHAARYFLPKSEFDVHPEWFRMDAEGNRTPKLNCCATNKEALDYIAARAVEAAKGLYRSSHRYFFWMDDSKEDIRCHCPECEKYSASDQQLLIMNRILEELRKYDPEATIPYLAYYDTLEPPTQVKPMEGIFLEYAPIDRDFHKPLSEANEKNESQYRHLQALLDFFGKDTAKALDYWLDNSLFSNWTKPPQPFTADADVILADLAHYKALGFRDISTFACYLGEDYIELHGEPDITPFAEAYHKVFE